MKSRFSANGLHANGCGEVLRLTAMVHWDPLWAAWMEHDHHHAPCWSMQSHNQDKLDTYQALPLLVAGTIDTAGTECTARAWTDENLYGAKFKGSNKSLFP